MTAMLDPVSSCPARDTAVQCQYVLLAASLFAAGTILEAQFGSLGAKVGAVAGTTIAAARTPDAGKAPAKAPSRPSFAAGPARKQP